MVAELTGFVPGQECPECGRIPVSGCWSIRFKALFCDETCLTAHNQAYEEKQHQGDDTMSAVSRAAAKRTATINEISAKAEDSGYAISLTSDDGNLSPSRRPGRKSTGAHTESPTLGRGAFIVGRTKKEETKMQTITPDLPKPEGEGWEWDAAIGAWVLPEGVDPVQTATDTAPAKKVTGAEAKAAREAKTAKAKEPVGEPSPCLCGCGMVPGRGSKFIPGHDATLKSRFLKLYRLEDAGEKAKALGGLSTDQKAYYDDLTARGILKPAPPKPVKAEAEKAEPVPA